MSNTCPICRSQNRPAARFCGACGAALTAAAPMPGRLVAGQVLKGRYTVIRPLSKGGMGAIYLVEDADAFGRQRVLKEMLDYVDSADFPDQAAYQQAIQQAHRRFEEEARTLASLKHRGIPDIIAYFSEGGHNYIVMEYVEGEDLKQYLDRNSRGQAAQSYSVQDIIGFGIQICKVLEYLAGLPRPLVHQDIKPANVIVNQATEARLVDFGTAKARFTVQLGGRVGLQKSSIYGTEGYAPPEQYRGQSDVKADVYALAATLYHVLTGDDPGSHPFQFPQLPSLPFDLETVLGQALRPAPAQRPTASEFRLNLEKTLEQAAPSAPARTQAAPAAPRGTRQSYAVLADAPPTNATRQVLISFLAGTLNTTAAEAEACTWQDPIVIATGLDPRYAMQMQANLRAQGLDARLVRTSQTPAWRMGLSPSDRRLAAEHQVVVALQNLPIDRLCHCYQCGHEWTTRARSFATLPPRCPQCGKAGWSRHRIFQCAVCRHQFTHANTVSPARQLFATCPACGASDWNGRSKLHLSKKTYSVDAGKVLVGQRGAASLSLKAAGDASGLRGRVVVHDAWLQSAQSPFQGGAVGFVVDTTGLAAKRTHRGRAQVISNAGVADIEISVYVDEPPCLEVNQTHIDFGLVARHDEARRQLVITNAGGQVLQGVIANTAPWLRLGSLQFSGDHTSIELVVRGSELTQAGANAATLTVQSNGGSAVVQVALTALPTTLAVDLASIDLGFQPQSKRKLRSQVRLGNRGVGQLSGTVTPGAPWLGVSPAQFSGNDVALQVVVRTAGLSPELHKADLTIASNGGNQAIPIAVRVSPYSWLRHQLHYRKSVALILIFALLCSGIVGWTIIITALATTPGRATTVRAAVYAGEGEIVYATGRHVYRLPATTGGPALLGIGVDPVQIAVSVDGGRVAWLRQDGGIELWRPGAPSSQRLLVGVPARTMAFLEQSDRLAILDHEGGFGWLDLVSNVYQVMGAYSDEGALPAFSGDGRTLSVVGQESISVYDAVDGVRLASIPFTANPTALALNVAGDELAWGDASGRVHHFVFALNRLHVLSIGVERPVTQVAFARQPGLLAWAYEGGPVVVYAFDVQRAMAADLGASVQSLAFDSHSGSLVIGASSGLHIMPAYLAPSE